MTKRSEPYSVTSRAFLDVMCDSVFRILPRIMWKKWNYLARGRIWEGGAISQYLYSLCHFQTWYLCHQFSFVPLLMPPSGEILALLAFLLLKILMMLVYKRKTNGHSVSKAQKVSLLLPPKRVPVHSLLCPFLFQFCTMCIGEREHIFCLHDF